MFFALHIAPNLLDKGSIRFKHCQIRFQFYNPGFLFEPSLDLGHLVFLRFLKLLLDRAPDSQKAALLSSTHRYTRCACADR